MSKFSIKQVSYDIETDKVYLTIKVGRKTHKHIYIPGGMDDIIYGIMNVVAKFSEWGLENCQVGCLYFDIETKMVTFSIDGENSQLHIDEFCQQMIDSTEGEEICFPEYDLNEVTPFNAGSEYTLTVIDGNGDVDSMRADKAAYRGKEGFGDIYPVKFVLERS